MLGTGPGTDKLARAIMETKAELDKIVTDLLNKLSTLSVSLDITINILDKDKYEVILGRSRDHLDSVRIRTERLLSMKERLDKRIERIAKQGVVGLAKFGYKKKQKIILHT